MLGRKATIGMHKCLTFLGILDSASFRILHLISNALFEFGKSLLFKQVMKELAMILGWRCAALRFRICQILRYLLVHIRVQRNVV